MIPRLFHNVVHKKCAKSQSYPLQRPDTFGFVIIKR
jgi:hypothetical protein